MLGLAIYSRRRFGIFPGEPSVVKTLAKQDDIGNGVVDGEDHHGWQDSLEPSAENIEDVAEKPYDDEANRERIGAAALPLFKNLWREHDDPTGN